MIKNFQKQLKKVPWTGNKDKECSNERITEIEKTCKDLNKARKVYFNLIKTQKMARTKQTRKQLLKEINDVKKAGRPPPSKSKCSLTGS